MEYQHEPVMLREVLEYLNPAKGKFFIDCTLGGGGYTFALAERAGKEGRVLAIDLDEMAIENFKSKVESRKSKDNIILVQDNFRNLAEIVKNNFENEIKFDGIVFDLGLSSAQLADRNRGFSFQADAALNMAFGQGVKETTHIINNYNQEELERIFREYGEERYAKSIARNIIKARTEKPIVRTGELVEIIRRSVPAVYKNKKIHFATRTFQALRIETNGELDNLEKVLSQAVGVLKEGGRIAVVSYHSLEDRIVKNFFRQESKECLCPPDFPICSCGHKARFKILTKKAIEAPLEEINKNPRARSAKLRAAEKI